MTDVRSVQSPATLVESTFDFARWKLEPRQVAAATAVIAYALALWLRDAPGDRVLGALAATETAVLCLPWRLPRSCRSSAAFWAESLAGLISPIGAVITAVVLRVPWLGVGSTWPWYLAGVSLGIAFLAIGGVRIGAVLSGEIAFAFGPTRRAHGRARAFSTMAGPPGEEALFRGPALLAPHPASLGLLASTAFVARHYVQPGSNGRGATRGIVVEVCAATSLLALVICSRSVYPALVAHVINNLPACVVELQRQEPDPS
jgi:hypothetical protein